MLRTGRAPGPLPASVFLLAPRAAAAVLRDSQLEGGVLEGCARGGVRCIRVFLSALQRFDAVRRAASVSPQLATGSLHGVCVSLARWAGSGGGEGGEKNFGQWAKLLHARDVHHIRHVTEDILWPPLRAMLQARRDIVLDMSKCQI